MPSPAVWHVDEKEEKYEQKTFDIISSLPDKGSDAAWNALRLAETTLGSGNDIR